MPTSTQRFRLVGEDDASRAFLEVAAASKLLKSNLDDVNSSLLGIGKLAGGASLIPVLAGAAAAVTELTTSLGAASLAGGVFGVSAAGVVAGMVKQQKSIGVTEGTLNGLTKGTQAYRDTLVRLHNKQAAFQKDYGKAAKGYDTMTSSFHKFLHETGPVTQGVLAKGFDLVASVLPKLVPVSNAAAHAVGGLIGDLQNWTEGPSFAHLIHFLETSGPKDITAFGHSIGNVLGGLGGILSNFVGPGDHAAKSLEHLTANFDKWGHSKGVSQGADRFLRYVGNNGPAISLAFESLAKASPKIATALGKIGSANLTLTSKFLSLIAGLPQKQFNLIADSLFAIAAGSKAIAAVNGLVGAGGALKSLSKSRVGGILGKSAASSVTGGVQKVFVVNMGKGFPGPGGPGSPVGPGVVPKEGPSFLQKAGTFAIGASLVTGLEAGASGILKAEYGKTVGSIFFQVQRSILNLPDPSTIELQTKVWGPVLTSVGRGLRRLGDSPGGLIGSLFSMPHDGNHGDIPDIKSTTTAVDSLKQHLSKASQAMDLVGHSAQRVFPDATKKVQDTSAKMTQLSGVKGEQAFDLIGHSATKNTTIAGRNVDVLTGKINHVPDRNVNITANTAGAQQSVEALIAAISRIHDKSFTITRTTNANVAEANNGGGGHHSGSGHGATAGPSRTSPTHVTNVTVNVASPVAEDPYTTGERVQKALDAYLTATAS